MNRRQAIRDKCLMCSEDVKKEVKNCPCTDCSSVLPYRFGRGKQEPKETWTRNKEGMYVLMAWTYIWNLKLRDELSLHEFRGYTRPQKVALTYKKVSSAGIPRHDLPLAEPEHQERENASTERLYYYSKKTT